MTGYIVTAAALVAKVSSDTGEGYFYRNDVLPKGVSVDECKRLEELGLVAKLTDNELELEASRQPEVKTVTTTVVK